MRYGLNLPVGIVLACLAWAGPVTAGEILVTEDIETSVTWTSNNVYNLQDQVYVLPGATLTIEAGTLVRSTADLGGSLAVCRGAKIYVLGKKEKPVIMTSTRDTLTSWHEGCNEWGNLTIMGNALISGSHYKGQVQSYQDGATASIHINTKLPDGLNKKQMEGLTAAFPGDPKVLYGGSDDDDDSGSIRYLSLRYGGKVIGLANELNGLSLGGVGRGTDISHVEIMNNVDDGIEIWGGTVNLKYVSIWNVGDDSFDVDQGWRGKVQFGLIVQGYSADAKQGSGVGDNCFEMDGAEDCDAQPVTTSTIYNFTVIGQPADGDHGTAWRDNARVQFRNCIFMDLGEELVKFDDDDTDGALGYSGNKSKNRTTSADGTLSWYGTWSTDAGVHSTVNAGTADLNALYPVQSSGKLAEISDSVFYNNLYSKAYIESASVGVHNPANRNVIAADGSMPIRALVRSASPFISSSENKVIYNVDFIDPLPAHDALMSAAKAPEDGFFTPVGYRGGFSPDYNWLQGWTAVDAYGMTDTSINGSSTGDLTYDFNTDGVVDSSDLMMLIRDWHLSK